MGKKAKLLARMASIESRKKKRMENKTKDDSRVTPSKKNSRMKNHPNTNCGNHACQKCFPLTFTGFVRKIGRFEIPFGMPQWMYLKWAAINQ